MKNACSPSATLSVWLCPMLLVSLVATVGPGHAQVTAATLSRLRPTSIPLVTHDPYFSIWSSADRLPDADTGQLAVLKLSSRDQRILARKGDDLRIDWGHFYLAAPRDARISAHLLPANTARTAFASGTGFSQVNLPMPVAAEDEPVAALAFPPTAVGAQPVSRWLMLACDDLYSIRYFRDDLRPYWRRNGTDAAELLAQAAADYPALLQRCKEFDAQLLADLRTLGGEPYSRLCALKWNL